MANETTHYTQVIVRIDIELLRQFRAECVRRGSNVSAEVAALIQRQVEAWWAEQLQTIETTRKGTPSSTTR